MARLATAWRKSIQFPLNAAVTGLPGARIAADNGAGRARPRAREFSGGKGRRLRKLGIIGGMSWSSTALYYEHINRGVAQRLGGLHSAPLAIESLDFAHIAAMEFAGRLGRHRQGS